MKILCLLSAAALLLGAQQAYAVTITNGDFESSTPSSATFATDGYSQEGTTSSALNGWVVSSGNVDIVGTSGAFGWQQPNGVGNFSIDLAGTQSGAITQGLSGLSLGQQYKISFDLSKNPGAGNPTFIQVGVDDGSNPAQLQSFQTVNGNSSADMMWHSVAWFFTATAANMDLSFSSTGGCCAAALDNVTIAATPIPGAILLFGSALGGMGLLGYRRKKVEAAA